MHNYKNVQKLINLWNISNRAYCVRKEEKFYQ